MEKLSSASDLQGTLPQRRASERFENDAGGFFSILLEVKTSGEWADASA